MNDIIDWQDDNNEECELLQIARRTIWHLARNRNMEIRRLMQTSSCESDEGDRVKVNIGLNKHLEPVLGIDLLIDEHSVENTRRSFGEFKITEKTVATLSQTMVRTVIKQLDGDLRAIVADSLMPTARDHFCTEFEVRRMYEELPALRSRLERLERRIRAGDFRLR